MADEFDVPNPLAAAAAGTTTTTVATIAGVRKLKGMAKEARDNTRKQTVSSNSEPSHSLSKAYEQELARQGEKDLVDVTVGGTEVILHHMAFHVICMGFADSLYRK